tara:strand:+ start:579 stop:5444 length:4866 start_codon:yes stop_codon:yes gene_type:complete
MLLNMGQRLALNIDSHIVVDAGAGTGKTSTIVDRALEHYFSKDQRATRITPVPSRPSRPGGGTHLSAPADTSDPQKWEGLLPGEVVLLTFTNKAADEMKDRLRSKISKLTVRDNPRVSNIGDPDMLLAQLEDAPVGTIDSFFNQLIAPYRGLLGDSYGSEIISDSARELSIDEAINTLWRLPSSKSRIGDAVDAGVGGEIAEEVLEARDRIARRYHGRWTSSRILRSLVRNSVFIDEGVRSISQGDGQIDRDLLLQRIMSSIDPMMIEAIFLELRSITNDFCEIVKRNTLHLSPKGWSAESRMACMDNLASSLPSQSWEQLVWMSHHMECTASQKSLQSKTPKIFPGRAKTLPNDGGWERGIETCGKISDARIKETVRNEIDSIVDRTRNLWSTRNGRHVLHFVQIAMLLDSRQPPCSPQGREPFSEPLPEEVPERIPTGKTPSSYHFDIDGEVQNLEDLRLVHLGFKGILKKMKETNEVEDFDDIQRLVGDLLLANCPESCKTFYPPQIISSLNSLKSEPWRDDHIALALEELKRLEENPTLAAESSGSLGAIRFDLETRVSILGEIRRRYRAFIIDEAQDNSPLQWRLLSRLWGVRGHVSGEPEPPDTPWQPTICFVGDVKQSIYAFRQAEVAGFLEYAVNLMSVNDHELSSVPELTRSPELRRPDESRDPRNAASIGFSKATKLLEDSGLASIEWIPFDLSDQHLPKPDQEEVNLRRRGLIRLQVNYRTDGGLLKVMDQWWHDILSDRHRDLPDGNFYATPQPLFPSPEKSGIPGSLEWICPVMGDAEENPPFELTTPLDAFEDGSPDSIERQSLLIAKRVRNLIDGMPVRVRGPSGDWSQLPNEKPVPPSDIMILLPSRSRLRDSITRQLSLIGIKSQADREGGLLDRPVAHSLNGLLQFLARPTSRHNAAWAARSSMIGLNDSGLQGLLEGAGDEEDLVSRMVEILDNDRLKSLVTRWRKLSSSGRIIDALEESIDNSDLLVANPNPGDRQDAEDFISLIRSLSKEIGGDPMVLADRISTIKESDSSSLQASSPVQNDAVRVMTIHGAKGLQSKVVILADVFSGRQTNLMNENKNKMIVTPEMFGGRPKPWPIKKSGKDHPHSPLWKHLMRTHIARKDAESRRLLYVAATRAESKLIITGSPKETEWREGEGLVIPWAYSSPIPQLGQMWIESLRQGSWERGEKESHWMSEDDSESGEKPPVSKKGERIFDPMKALSEGFLGSNTLPGLTLIHHPDCLDDPDNGTASLLTPLQMIEMVDDAARESSMNHVPPMTTPRWNISSRVRVTPHRLSTLQKCKRRYWLETRGGLTIEKPTNNSKLESEADLPQGIDAAGFGKIVHRTFEIGLGNPGPPDGENIDLPDSWASAGDDKLDDASVIGQVLDEFLPSDADREACRSLMGKMLSRIKEGIMGDLVSGRAVNGHIVEGLRTEMPFHLSKTTPLDRVVRTRWTPDGPEPLSAIDEVAVEMDGVIDLVLCTVSGEGKHIRPIDLKTEEAHKLNSGSLDGLVESHGNHSFDPQCDAEIEMLENHSMQLALYYLALRTIEEEREKRGLPSRTVLRPAILVGVTGRIVEYPEEMFNATLKELDKALSLAAAMSLESEPTISDYECSCANCPQ